MDKQLIIPLGNYNGTREFGPATIADTYTRAGLELQRCTSADTSIWPDEATTVEVSAEMSVDGGATWQGLGGFSAQGGIHVKADLTELPYSYYLTWFPPGTNRRVRGTVVITNGPLRTSGSLLME